MRSSIGITGSTLQTSVVVTGSTLWTSIGVTGSTLQTSTGVTSFIWTPTHCHVQNLCMCHWTWETLRWNIWQYLKFTIPIWLQLITDFDPCSICIFLFGAGDSCRGSQCGAGEAHRGSQCEAAYAYRVMQCGAGEADRGLHSMSFWTLEAILSISKI